MKVETENLAQVDPFKLIRGLPSNKLSMGSQTLAVIGATFGGGRIGFYLGMRDVLQEYAASQRLYLTPDERRKQLEVLSTAAKAIKVLDLSGIPPVLRDTVAPERAIQLKEIFDRIEFPSFESIPDQDAVARASSKRWRLPGTEIDIALIENGPRSGEYLVSADTVDRLPEFYGRVEKLPYKPGPAAELSDVYRRMAGGAATIYDAGVDTLTGGPQKLDC
jgi:hypothetical protein